MPLYAHRHAHAHTCAHKTYFLNFSSGNKTVLTCATQCLIPWLKPASDSLTGTHLHCCVVERLPQMKGHKHQKGKRDPCDAFTSPYVSSVWSPLPRRFTDSQSLTMILPCCLIVSWSEAELQGSSCLFTDLSTAVTFPWLSSLPGDSQPCCPTIYTCTCSPCYESTPRQPVQASRSSLCPPLVLSTLRMTRTWGRFIFMCLKQSQGWGKVLPFAFVPSCFPKLFTTQSMGVNKHNKPFWCCVYVIAISAICLHANLN